MLHVKHLHEQSDASFEALCRRLFWRICNPPVASIGICNAASHVFRDCKSLYSLRSDCKSDRTGRGILPVQQRDNTRSGTSTEAERHIVRNGVPLFLCSQVVRRDLLHSLHSRDGAIAQSRQCNCIIATVQTTMPVEFGFASAQVGRLPTIGVR